MIKVVLFDCDGPIIRREKYFSQRLLEERGIYSDAEREDSFFKTEFLDCEIGKTDLKEVLPKWLKVWKWRGSVDELLEYWFFGESQKDELMLEHVQVLRKQGIQCLLATNNEKYRVQYLWQVVGLKNYFDGCFASCDLGYLKNERGFWEKLMESLGGFEPDEVLLIDDDLENIESAKAFGLNAELYRDVNSIQPTIDLYLNTV